MAPLPPNSTDRLKVFYQNAEAEHNAVIRLSAQDGLAEAQATFEAITTEFGAAFNFSEVTAVQLSLTGSDIFLDVVGATLIGHTWGTGPATEQSNATALTFVGRTLNGRRSRFSLFGWAGVLSEFRLLPAESVELVAALADLLATADSFLAIDGAKPVWKQYANIKPFDHWVGVARNG